MGQVKPSRVSWHELDARLHDAALELAHAELPSLAAAVEQARRQLQEPDVRDRRRRRGRAP